MKSKMILWAGHMSRIRETRNTYRILVEKPLENIHLEDPRRTHRLQ